ncbi:hypothetical protein TNCV_4144921 [Trichonephila clavipes]|nr:hypothetical protein TNCV_4144921 [Trichonephila clavipes]
MELKATDNDRRPLETFRYEFRGPRYGSVRQVLLLTTTTTLTSKFEATQGLLIVSLGKVTRTTPELPPQSRNFLIMPTGRF